MLFRFNDYKGKQVNEKSGFIDAKNMTSKTDSIKLRKLGEPVNHLPDCVALSIDGKPSRGSKCALILTINFAEQTIPVPMGSIRVGIRSGELRLVLQNSNMPMAERSYFQELDARLSATRKLGKSGSHSSGTERTQSATTKGTINPTKQSGEVSVALGQSALSEEELGLIEETQFKLGIHQIRAKGADNRPAWDFETRTGEEVLRGGLLKEKLGVLTIQGSPASVTATFEVSPNDVHVTAATGPWCEGTSLNKVSILKRLTLLRNVMNKIVPYISKVELVGQTQ